MANFEKIIGYEGIKEELRRICDVLKNPKKYEELGVTTPRGLLLHGAAGVGKTTMAMEFIEEVGSKAYVLRKKKSDGEFTKEIIRVFEEAKENEPCVILLDDMDKFANEDEAHKNAEEFVIIQSCIDDIRDHRVFVIATVNSLRDISDSLTRMGRFDKSITIDRPEGKEAEDIVNYYLSKKKFVGEVNAGEIARILDGRSCADLETVINEAGIFAGYAGKTCIDMNDIVQACMRVLFGAPEGNSLGIDVDVKKIAYHEAGHTVIAEICNPGSVNLVSISGKRDDVGGFCRSTKPDGYFSSKEMMEDRVVEILGGKAAIEVIFGVVDTGANSDIRNAFSIVERFADHYCAYGFESWIRREEPSDRLRSNKETRMVMDMENCYQRAKRIIVENRNFAIALAETLLEQKVLTGVQVREIRDRVA